MTAEELRNLLSYNPDTGEFIWIVRPSKAVKNGDIAGVIDKRGYRTIGIKGKIYKAHRLAWLYVHGSLPTGLIDHINGDKSDNKIQNLRDVFADGNSQNIRKPNKRNKSGFLGVIFFQNKWRASITVNSKTQWLGDYSTPEEAHAAYLGAKRLHHAACTI
jgi:hypothetical protein